MHTSETTEFILIPQKTNCKSNKLYMDGLILHFFFLEQRNSKDEIMTKKKDTCFLIFNSIGKKMSNVKCHSMFFLCSSKIGINFKIII